jgi:hypothetical protein
MRDNRVMLGGVCACTSCWKIAATVLEKIAPVLSTGSTIAVGGE